MESRRLVLIVNLAASAIIWKLDPFVCLCGIFLIELVEARGSAHCDGTIPCWGSWTTVSGEWVLSCTSRLSLLLPDYDCCFNVLSLHLASTIDYMLQEWSRIIPFSFGILKLIEFFFGNSLHKYICICSISTPQYPSLTLPMFFPPSTLEFLISFPITIYNIYICIYT